LKPPPQSISTADVVIERVSPLRLADPGPDAQSLDRILAAGLRAPDHGHLRPWRFFVIRGEARRRFGDLLAESLGRRIRDTTAASLDAERAKALRAPVIVVVAVTPRDTQRIPAVEQVLSAGAAAQNMLIAAHALGYGAFWRTGAAAYDPVLAAGLGLAGEDSIAGFIYIGNIAAPGKAKVADPAGVVEEWTGVART
jgi:nitroreductase